MASSRQIKQTHGHVRIAVNTFTSANMDEYQMWAQIAKKYTVHEETYLLTRNMLASGFKPYNELGLEKARQQVNERIKMQTPVTDYSGDEWEVIVPSPYSKDGIPVTVFKPSSAPEVPAIFVYFHGGGLLVGNRKLCEGGLKIFARDSGAIVLNVEFRLLPDPIFPLAPFDDGVIVTNWVLQNKEAVGGHPHSKVGVGGDSGGGSLAASVTNDVRGLDFQVLVYPMTDTTLSSPTIQEFAECPIMRAAELKWFLDTMMAHIPDYNSNPRVNLMARTNTGDSPPALMILSELDPLKGCGLDYADKLRAAGVSVECEIIKGVPHVFFMLRDVFKTKSAEAYAHVVKYLKKFQ
ncbi:unnamed protein product [Lymnaea stagnalis]|uniref:Alpha/beta hydrolase fold-3 domain-containing protein n=1 Tax=Lymnaea stagnalis TaxID=6523 RepID=A0AAV2ID36_LYMST